MEGIMASPTPLEQLAGRTAKTWLVNMVWTEPKTWSEYNKFRRQVVRGNWKACAFTRRRPFFIDQLFAELVANNGGVLFDTVTFRPLLTSAQVVEVLQFFKNITPYVDKNWPTLRYLEQFNVLGRGDAVSVPSLTSGPRSDSERRKERAPPLSASPDVFALMPQPRGTQYQGPPIATIDCEPYVIFKRAQTRRLGSSPTPRSQNVFWNSLPKNKLSGIHETGADPPNADFQGYGTQCRIPKRAAHSAMEAMGRPNVRFPFRCAPNTSHFDAGYV